MHKRRASQLAACFAVSNLGMETYLDSERAAHFPWPDNPRSAVERLAGHLMESDEHEEIFADEAQGYFNRFVNLTVEEALEQFSYNLSRSWFKQILNESDADIVEYHKTRRFD